MSQRSFLSFTRNAGSRIIHERSLDMSDRDTNIPYNCLLWHLFFGHTHNQSMFAVISWDGTQKFRCVCVGMNTIIIPIYYSHVKLVGTVLKTSAMGIYHYHLHKSRTYYNEDWSSHPKIEIYDFIISLDIHSFIYSVDTLTDLPDDYVYIDQGLDERGIY